MAKRKTKKIVYEHISRYVEELKKRNIKIDQAYLFGSEEIRGEIRGTLLTY